MTLEEYCQKLYNYNEPIKEINMKTCKAVFTIIDDEDTKFNRTEVVEMIFEVPEKEDMITAMLNYLDDEKSPEEDKQPIITNH